MRVRELIEELQKFDPELVVYHDEHFGEYHPAEVVRVLNENHSFVARLVPNPDFDIDKPFKRNREIPEYEERNVIVLE